MNTVQQNERNLTTADLVAASQAANVPSEATGNTAPEALVELFAPDVADDFRARWDGVQIGFVDDPQQAVQKADELVARVMASLAETFAGERTKLERSVAENANGGASTENLRVALRRYRSFFQRLLSL